VKDRVFIPMRLQAGLSASTRRFLRERSASILGRELVARPPNIFVPGFFPLLQLKAFERTGTSLWKGGVSLTCGDGDDTVGTIEALELRGEARLEDTHITRLLVCVYSRRDRSSAAALAPLRRMLKLCLDLVKDTLRELLPAGLDDLSSRVDTFAVGPGCIWARIDEAAAAATAGACSQTHPINASNTARVSGLCSYRLEKQGELPHVDEHELSSMSCPNEGAGFTVADLFCACDAAMAEAGEECCKETGEGNR
jgi:hypothetical protein